MLIIRVKPEAEPVLTDIDFEFSRILFADSNLTRIFLSEIEQGCYKDTMHFIDRFGDKLLITYLSTGTKAACVIASNPDVEIDITEVGLNARDSIIRNISNGKIAMQYPGVTISSGDEDCDAIDVSFDNYHFTSLSRLNYYIKEEMGWEPDMSLPGIARL